MKAAFRVFGASSLALAASVASATSMEKALQYPEEVGAVDSSEAATIVYDQQVEATAYGNHCADDCDAGCSDLCTSLCAPTWKVRAGAAILTRSRPDQVVLARPLGGLFQISGGEDFDFGYAGGPDVSIERRIGNGPNSIEARFLGGLEWNSPQAYGLTGDISIGPIDIPFAIDVNANYESKLNSTEINWRHQRSERVTWLTGFRIIELHEEIGYGVDFVVPNLTTVSWNTDNHMYGGQVGADVQLWKLNAPLSVNGLFKAGIYGNDADNDYTFDVLGTPIADGGADANPVSFVGEIGVTTTYQLTRHLALRGGYQMLWISEVALASDQIQTAFSTGNVDTINSSGDLFYHGALVGAEFTW